MPPTRPPAGPHAPLLRMTDVSHKFDGRTILAGLSLTLTPGDVMVVTGANGAGKSTLLRIAAGLLKPTSGGAERGGGMTGYAAPDLQPWSELSARENLDFLARIRGCADAGREAIKWLEAAGFPAVHLPTPAATLSTGQRQRLKLAMAWLGRPTLLILDEPGSNLDDEGRSLVARLIGEARCDGAVLLATNDSAEAALGGRHLELRVLD